MKINAQFNDTFCHVIIKAFVGEHEVYMTATHWLEMDDYKFADRDLYNVVFTVDCEQDVREVSITRKEKLAICKLLKDMWQQLQATVIEEFGEEAAFMCEPYLKDGKGEQRIANYVKQGFTYCSAIGKYVYLPY